MFWPRDCEPEAAARVESSGTVTLHHIAAAVCSCRARTPEPRISQSPSAPIAAAPGDARRTSDSAAQQSLQLGCQEIRKRTKTLEISRGQERRAVWLHAGRTHSGSLHPPYASRTLFFIVASCGSAFVCSIQVTPYTTALQRVKARRDWEVEHLGRGGVEKKRRADLAPTPKMPMRRRSRAQRHLLVSLLRAQGVGALPPYPRGQLRVSICTRMHGLSVSQHSNGNCSFEPL